MADFTTTTWVDNADPAITAAQLNRMEAGIADAVRAWKTGTLAARPTANAASRYWAYFATDDTGGTLYVNFDGATWTKVASGLSAAGGSSGPTIIRGSVNGDGTIRAGTGFTVARLAVGDYRVTFTTAFASVASVNVTAYTGGAALSMVKLYAAEPPTVSTFRAIAFRLSDGNSQDSGFDFHAIPV